MQQGAWRIPFAGFTPSQPQPLFRYDTTSIPDHPTSTWQQPSTGEWSANNNKINEWKKWSSLEAPSAELARPRPQLLSPHFGSPVLPGGQAALPAARPAEVTREEQPCEPMDQHDIHNLKEEERKSAEHHSASYDASATPSLSGDDDERRLDVEGGEDHQSEDVEVEDRKTPAKLRMQTSTDYETDEGHPDDNDDNQVSTTTAHKEDEASHLLLNFSQQSFTSASDQTRIQCLPSPTESGKASDPNVPTTTTHSTTPTISSAFSGAAEQHAAVVVSTPDNNPSFCRPPGLGPAAFCTPTTGQSAALVCPICGFSCNSKFHYNSHMNTHGDHQCSMCDYTSRTEGRLKKHMRESHTVEEQLAVGLEIKPATPVPSGATSVVTSTPQCSSLADTASLSTTMASLVDVANMAAAAVAVKQEIRAFAENSALLPDSGTTLANALGVMSQEVSDGINRTPEKLNNSEPRRNSNGKMKQYKCKQCPHISFSKDDQWAHARTHIPVDKQMNCPTCNFVTEYKHHLEYHIRNHIGSKPFQCKKCSYTCVNKSMLNSHMKSHTNVYQFRCMDCTYATKYCHSLKLHLKKYDHRRVPDGMDIGDTSPTQVKPESLTPYPNFGLKLDAPSPATTLAQTLGLAPIVTSQSLNYASQMLLRQHQMEQMSSLINGLPTLPQPLKCAVCDFQTSSQEELMRHNVNHFLSQPTQSPIVSLYQALPQMSSFAPPLEGVADKPVSVDTHEERDSGHLHLKKYDHRRVPDGMDIGDTSPTQVKPESLTPYPNFGLKLDAPSPATTLAQTLGLAPIVTSQSLNYASQMLLRQHQMEQMSSLINGLPTLPQPLKCAVCDFQTSSQEELMRHNVNHFLSQPTQSPIVSLYQALPQMSSFAPPLEGVADKPVSVDTHEERDSGHQHVKSSDSPTPDPPTSTSSISVPFAPLSSDGNLNIFQQAYLAQLNVLTARREEASWRFQCQHCRMAFQDQALYNIHMGYHGYEHVFKCNRCGHIAPDSLNFNLHLLQASHE
ncbi:zinc finger, C2H2 type [Ancylostoma duodenale]|uniref:Zinc finger, C2H2 type n=1 Tax=Ancylostoma duodenale TaxID=51022 RepID=A0A0C2DEX7_9BILA|nr:zinc finger, C2H2 type [Ancylostoma duodenale]